MAISAYNTDEVVFMRLFNIKYLYPHNGDSFIWITNFSDIYENVKRFKTVGYYAYNVLHNAFLILIHSKLIDMLHPLVTRR